MIDPANAHLLKPHFAWLAEELPFRLPCAAILHNGAAVSVCCSSRNGPDAAEAGLETVEAFRGRGFAPAVVASWGYAVRESGRTPLYSTSWDNLASQAVARKLGLALYGVDMSIT
jgi:RimJ/RimL family protein N-acetyltransferase